MKIIAIRTALIGCIVGMFFSIAVGQHAPYGNVMLLDGYRFTRGSGTSDTINGVIYREGGTFTIEFEAGVSEGYAADPEDRTLYSWFSEQVINGNRVYLAMTKRGLGTKWQPKIKRNAESGMILMITFPGSMGSNHAANFYGYIADDKELAEMILMVLTFDPKKIS